MIVTVIVSDSPVVASVTVMVNASVTVSPASSAVVSASELSRVYVQVAPDIARLPYVPDELPTEYETDASPSGSTVATVSVTVEVDASSVTEPV